MGKESELPSLVEGGQGTLTYSPAKFNCSLGSGHVPGCR